MRNKKNVLLALFLLSLAAGLYYPVYKIIRFEFSLTPPAIVRFNAQIYDPYDPFRGRYVAFTVRDRVELARGVDDSLITERSSSPYAVLETDAKGVAKIVDLAKKPQAGKINLRLEKNAVFVSSRNTDDDNKVTYNVNLPFYRFYMNEKLAPDAELVVGQALRGGRAGTCQIVVKIYANGAYAISGLEIDGVPIHEFLRKVRTEPAEENAGRAVLAAEDIDKDKEEANITEFSKTDEPGDVIFVPD